MRIQTPCAIALAVSLTAPVASAQLTPITPAGLGPNAVAETFEGELTVTIPQSSFGANTVPWGPVPQNHVFPTGVQLTGQSAAPDDISLYDYAPASGIVGGWGLGVCPTGGNLDNTTALPSGTALIAQANFSNNGPMELTFPAPTFVVGAWVEAGCGSAGTAVLEAFDAGGASLGTHQVVTDGLSDNALDSFIGVLSTVPIAKVRINLSGGVLDDLTFEPCSSGSATQYGQGCPSGGGFPTTPELKVTGSPCEGNLVNFEITKGLGGSTALLILGTGQSNLPVGGGCSLLSSPIIGAPIPVPLSGTLPGQGQITIPVVLPLGLAGTPFTTQAFVIDPSTTIGASATNGVQVIIG